MTGCRKNRRSGGQGATVSLFPFLAVLLCTMGMLVMLLVLVSQNTAENDASPLARSEIAAPNEPKISESPDDDFFDFDSAAVPVGSARAQEKGLAVPVGSAGAQEKGLTQRRYEELKQKYGDASFEDVSSELEGANWFLQELDAVHRRTAEALAKERDRLAAAEKLVADMVHRLVELNAQALALKNGSADENAEESPEAVQNEIEKTAAEVANLSSEIERLKQNLKDAQGKKSYAILPYRGKSGTLRRPIYVECTADGIYLVPENVPFLPEDFLLAKYPGNPFDAAMRAARQYYVEQGADAESEPYPLLIVRPGAAEKYYAAKAALASWGGDYGYEFVENDANLEFPAADMQLARRVEEQVALARARLAVPLAAIVGEMTRSGTFAGGSGEENSSDAGGLGSQFGPYAKLETTAGQNNAPSGNGLNGSSVAGLGTAGLGTAGNPNVGYGASAERLPAYRGRFAAGAPSGLENAADANASADGVNTYRSASSANRYASGGEKSGNPLVGTPPSDGATAIDGAPSEMLASSTAPPEGNVNTAAPSSPFVETTRSTQNASSSSVDPRQTVGNTVFAESEKNAPPENNQKTKAEENPKAINLAEELRRPSQMAIERPILLECRADRYVFAPQPGLKEGFEVKISESSERELLETIVFCVKSWNVAGRNMYWAPWIKASVAAGGEENFARLEQMMNAQQVRIDRVK